MILKYVESALAVISENVVVSDISYQGKDIELSLPLIISYIRDVASDISYQSKYIVAILTTDPKIRYWRCCSCCYQISR